MSTFAPISVGSLTANYLAGLESFAFANATGTKLFSVTNNYGQTLTFVINSVNAPIISVDVNGPTLAVSGSGSLLEDNFNPTIGTFNLLTSSTTGITGFKLVTTADVAATPEPSSMALLGTGVLGVLCLARRRFIRV